MTDTPAKHHKMRLQQHTNRWGANRLLPRVVRLRPGEVASSPIPSDLLGAGHELFRGSNN